MRITSTGWWGIPGREPRGRGPLVHAICDQKAICGKIPHPKSQYQWCASGLHREYVDCQGCLKILNEEQMTKKQALEELKRVKDNLATMQQTIARLKKRVEQAERVLVKDE